MKVTNLCKTYATKTGEKVHALKNVSFDLPSSGMVVILGKSGCGKSTLLNILGGLDRFDSGDVECFGKSLMSLSRKELDNYRNFFVGFVFQEYHLIPELDVAENIALPLQLQGETDTEEKVKSALQQVGMVGFDKRKVEELSGGQKQRVAIARALVKDPKIILADEPTGALDSHSGENILKILKWISQEKLVVLVTHDREFAEQYGDRIIELADGVVMSDSDRSYQETDTEEKAKLQKSRLPIKTAFKIGRSNFQHHRNRLTWTILLSVIAFSLLALSLSVAFLNPAHVFCREIIRSDMELTAIYKLHWYRPENVVDQSLDRFLGDDGRYNEDVPMTMEDVEFLKSLTGNSYSLVYTDLVFSFQDYIAASLNQQNEARRQNPEICYANCADGYIAMTEEECEKLGLTVIGELPKNAGEVAINECLFNIFAIKGLIEGGTIFELSSYEDIIGHKIPVHPGRIISNGPYYSSDPSRIKTITGVVITGCSRKCFNEHYAPEDRSTSQNWETYHEKIFVCEDYFDEYTYALCAIPQDRTELKEMVNFILGYEENNLSYTFVNKLSDGFYDSLEAASLLKMLFIYLSVIFLFFAMLLLSNYIFSSMQRQTKQIGILSALGAGFGDLCKVYGSAIVALCSMIAAITLVLQVLTTGWFNNYLQSITRYLRFSLVRLNLPASLLLIGVIAAVAAAGCLIHLIHIRKFNPTAIINKGQIK